MDIQGWTPRGSAEQSSVCCTGQGWEEPGPAKPSQLGRFDLAPFATSVSDTRTWQVLPKKLRVKQGKSKKEMKAKKKKCAYMLPPLIQPV